MFVQFMDIKNKKVVRKIHEHTFTGEETWSAGSTSTTAGWGGTTTVGFYQYYDGTNGQRLFNDFLPSTVNRETINSSFISTTSGCYSTSIIRSSNAVNNNYYCMRVSRALLETYGSDNSSETANRNAFNAWLKDMYDNLSDWEMNQTNPFHFVRFAS